MPIRLVACLFCREENIISDRTICFKCGRFDYEGQCFLLNKIMRISLHFTSMYVCNIHYTIYIILLYAIYTLNNLIDITLSNPSTAENSRLHQAISILHEKATSKNNSNAMQSEAIITDAGNSKIDEVAMDNMLITFEPTSRES